MDRWISILALSLAVVAAAPTFPQARDDSDPARRWNQWRGPTRDGRIPARTLPEPWPSELHRRWRTLVGAGYSSPVAEGQHVWVHTRGDEEERVISLELSDGSVRWRDSYAAPTTKTPEFARSEGEGPYATPVLHAGILYTLGVNAVLTAYDADAGTIRWRRDLGDRIVETQRFCGIAPSPLVVGDTLVVQVGDDDSGEVLALDLDTGEPVWAWATDGPGNASPQLATLGDVAQIVVVTDRVVAGLDPTAGAPWWIHPYPAPPGGCSLNIPTPVVQGDSLILSSLDRGTRAISIARDGEVWRTTERWANESVAPHWSNAVSDGVELFGISQRQKGQLYSVDVETGESLWSSPGRSGENGFALDAGGFVLFLLNDGDLVRARKTRPGLEVATRQSIADSAIWSHPAVRADGLIVKDMDSVAYWTFVAPGNP